MVAVALDLRGIIGQNEIAAVFDEQAVGGIEQVFLAHLVEQLKSHDDGVLCQPSEQRDDLLGGLEQNEGRAHLRGELPRACPKIPLVHAPLDLVRQRAVGGGAALQKVREIPHGRYGPNPKVADGHAVNDRVDGTAPGNFRYGCFQIVDALDLHAGDFFRRGANGVPGADIKDPVYG